MTFIQTLSTYSALLPIIIGSFAIRRSRHYLFFWFFLLYGFLTDNISMSYQLSGESRIIYDVAVANQNLYACVDAVFLCLFIGLVYPEKGVMKWFYTMAVLLLFGWLFFYLIVKESWFENRTMSAFYDTAYHMVLSILASLALIKMTSTHSVSPRADMWLLIGVFFYNFCVFVVMALLDTIIIVDLWFWNSLFNVITMCFYALGYYVAVSNKESTL